MGGIPFIVSVYESLTAPYFSQMTDMNLLLLSGSNTSPVSSMSNTGYIFLTLNHSR